MTLHTTPRVYSYTRFSTPEQAQGDSSRRQAEAAHKWAEARGLVLDDKLTHEDLGVSAYRGTNTGIDTGLGRFLEACREGLIPPGSFLLVESLDRISRMTPLYAQRIMFDIVTAGVTLVTLNDGQEFTTERLENDPTALLISLMVSWRAHEESKVKGRRVAAAWSEKRRKVRNGQSAMLTRRAPSWLAWDGTGWTLKPDHAASVRRVYRLTLEGMGEHSIAALFNQEGVPVMGRGKMWHRSAISKLLRNPAVTGALVPGYMDFTGPKKRRVTEEPIAGAFPAVVSNEDWLAVRSLKDGKASAARGRGANSPLSNIFGGLARCGDCGAAMTRVYKGRKGGKPKLVCTRSKAGAADHPYRAVCLPTLQDAFLANWGALFADVPAGDRDETLDAQHNNLTGTIDHKIDVLERLLEVTRRSPSRALAEQIAAIETEIRDYSAQLRDIEGQREQADHGLVQVRLGNLMEALGGTGEPLSIPAANAALKVLFDGVTVDTAHSVLRFHWRQGGESAVIYGWPSEGGAQ